MDIQERAALAVELKEKKGYNCCQAVTAALGDLTELTPEQLRQLAAGFAIGMGNMEATCGALIGAGMIAGLVTEGRMTVRYNRQILEGFRSRCGAVTCKELKGLATGRVLCPCQECVRNAVLTFGDVMGVK